MSENGFRFQRALLCCLKNTLERMAVLADLKREVMQARIIVVFNPVR